MNKQLLNKNFVIYSIEGLVLFISLIMLYVTKSFYNFSNIEQWNTFVYDSTFISENLDHPGGFITLASYFLIQFFQVPITGIFITSLILSFIGVVMASILARWTGNKWSSLLSVFPVIALYILHFDVNYQYTGTIAILLMMVCLRLYFLFKRVVLKLIFSISISLLLFFLAGPIALLYGLLVLIVECYNDYRKAFWFISVPAAVYIIGLISVNNFPIGDLNYYMSPSGYFVSRLKPSPIYYLPWVLTIIVFFAGGFFKYFKLNKNWIIVAYCLMIVAGAVIFNNKISSKNIKENNEIFKELNYYSNQNRWDDIIERCTRMPMTNLLFQNFKNMALAEKGILADYLFLQPCQDMQSVCVAWNRAPHVSALLSDVYYSMGHLAYSQRFAFEANNGMGDYSPRMIKRLAQTNIIYGNYAAAQKYLKVLEHTLNYKEWAVSYERFLWNDKEVEKDKELGLKRKCLFPDNRFSGMYGLDDDLKNIVVNNPEHKATVMYLGSLYLLSRDLPRFMEVVSTFYGTKALPTRLPLAFQEAVAVYARGDAEVLKQYNIDASVDERYRAFWQNRLNEKSNYWFFFGNRR